MVRAPSLIITGQSDLFTPPALARAVARELADMEIERWEKTGYVPLLGPPRRFNHPLVIIGISSMPAMVCWAVSWEVALSRGWTTRFTVRRTWPSRGVT